MILILSLVGALFVAVVAIKLILLLAAFILSLGFGILGLIVKIFGSLIVLGIIGFLLMVLIL